MKLIRFMVLLLALATIISCNNAPKNKAKLKSPKIEFSSEKIVDDAQTMWAMAVGDITGDGIADIIFINNNSAGGFLGYYKGQKEKGLWEMIKIAEEPPGGGTFASGDLEVGDMDGDGDLDVMAVKHTGEWDSAAEPSELYWYENPGWEPHEIGIAPNFVKDMSLADFNKDKRMDVVVICNESHNLSIYMQNLNKSFTRIKSMNIANLHEGMDLGDTDGDGYIDISVNGFCLHNPKGNLREEWAIETIDRKWHTQSGDWSANATKNFCADINGDGRYEVFISHSERNGYPICWYYRSATDWVKHVIADSISSCHTLQVFDFDNDGDLDVLAGVNKGRAQNIGQTEFPVTIYVNDGSNDFWRPVKIADGGIYNGRVADYDGDGDMDIFRLPEHEAHDVYLMKNLIIK